MKKEMTMLEEMVQDGKILDVDRWKFIHALDESEKRTVWEAEGEFDPRRFMARMQHSSSETMLDDIIRLERPRVFAEIEERIRGLSGLEREAYLTVLDSLQACDTADVVGLSLLGKLNVLHERHGLEALSLLAALKSLEEFAECAALHRDFELERAKQEIMRNVQLEHAQAEYQTSLEARVGDVVRLHVGYGRLEVVQSPTSELKVSAQKHCWADTQEEAQKGAEAVEIWTFFEGNRIWILNSIQPPLRAQIDLRLEVPIGVHVIGGATTVSAKDVQGDFHLDGNEISVEGFKGHLSVGADLKIGRIHLRHVDGRISAEVFNAPLEIEDCRADVEARSVLSDIRISRHAGLCRLQSFVGNLILNDVCTSELDVKTKNGSIYFDGTVMPAGSYTLQTQTGDIEVALSKYSDCGLTAETQEGKIDWTLKARGGPWGTPNRLYANVRWGSGGFNATSKSGNIVIRAKA